MELKQLCIFNEITVFFFISNKILIFFLEYQRFSDIQKEIFLYSFFTEFNQKKFYDSLGFNK